VGVHLTSSGIITISPLLERTCALVYKGQSLDHQALSLTCNQIAASSLNLKTSLQEAFLEASYLEQLPCTQLEELSSRFGILLIPYQEGVQTSVHEHYQLKALVL